MLQDARRPGDRGALGLGRARLPGDRPAARGARRGRPDRGRRRHGPRGRRRDADRRPASRESCPHSRRPTRSPPSPSCWRASAGSAGRGRTSCWCWSASRVAATRTSRRWNGSSMSNRGAAGSDTDGREREARSPPGHPHQGVGRLDRDRDEPDDRRPPNCHRVRPRPRRRPNRPDPLRRGRLSRCRNQLRDRARGRRLGRRPAGGGPAVLGPAGRRRHAPARVRCGHRGGRHPRALAPADRADRCRPPGPAAGPDGLRQSGDRRR